MRKRLFSVGAIILSVGALAACGGTDKHTVTPEIQEDILNNVSDNLRNAGYYNDLTNMVCVDAGNSGETWKYECVIMGDNGMRVGLDVRVSPDSYIWKATDFYAGDHA